MSLIKRLWQWIKEPRKTSGEAWAVENGHYKAYMLGYTERGKNPFHAGGEKYLAFEHGKQDAEFDLDRQW